MSFLAMMELQSKANKLKLSDDPSQYLDLLRGIGIVDDKTVLSVLNAARIVSKNPEETVMDFVRGGGLGRLIAGQKPGEEPEDVVMSCPHCDGTIIGSFSAP